LGKITEQCHCELLQEHHQSGFGVCETWAMWSDKSTACESEKAVIWSMLDWITCEDAESAVNLWSQMADHAEHYLDVMTMTVNVDMLLLANDYPVLAQCLVEDYFTFDRALHHVVAMCLQSKLFQAYVDVVHSPKVSVRLCFESWILCQNSLCSFRPLEDITRPRMWTFEGLILEEFPIDMILE
jgi:hypothetical protein